MGRGDEGRGALRRALLRARRLPALGRVGRARAGGGRPRGGGGDDRPRRALVPRRRRGRAGPGRGAAGRRRRLPGPARALRRGRQRPGAARVARRPLRRLRRARLGDLHGQADPEAALRPARGAAGRVRPGGRGGLARALRGDGPAALGEALAARLQRRDQQGRAAGGSRRRGRAGPPPRPARHRRGLGRRPRGRVLGARQRAARDLAAGRDRRPRRLVRLRGEVRRGRHGAGRAGADPRAAGRPRPRAGGVDLRAGGLLRPRPLRLLRRARRGGPRQRDQHDARLHRDQRLREALRGNRHPLRRPLRPPGRARGRAPRQARSYEF